MLFAFDEDSIRSDVPSDFVRFFGSGFLSSIPEILAVQASRPDRLRPLSVRGQVDHVP
jgi:hypothetical protein